MSLTDREQHVLAYYLANGAQDFTMVGRFFPHGELVLVLQDKIQVANRKFGTKASMACPKAAAALLDTLIEKQAFSTTPNKFGGTMHQFQPDIYPKVLKELREANPIVQKAEAAGPDFWPEAFAALG
jgi:hypothetical protein